MSKKRGTGHARTAAAAAPVPEKTARRDASTILQWPVAIGLALLMLARPIWDGSVYVYSNLWFLYGIYGVFALWGLGMLIWGGTPFRFTRHLFLLGAFLSVAALMSMGTVDADQSYRALLVWLGHLLVFMMACSALRSPVPIAIVFGAFAVATFGEVVFSWIHYHYVLPFLRRQLMAHPSLLMSYFGASELTPDLASRLNANRAFGSFLFANALAAYLILGLPYFAGELANTFRRFLGLSRDPGGREPGSSVFASKYVMAVVVGILVWLATLSILAYTYRGGYVLITGRTDWWVDKQPIYLYVGLVPLVMGIVPGLFIAGLGLKKGWYAYQSAFLAVTASVSAYILYLTFSRGGSLALVLATVVGLALLWWARRRTAPDRPEAVRAAVAGVGVVLVAVSALAATTDAAAQAPPAPAAAAPASPNAPQLTEQGTDLTLKDLSNPMTFWLRLEYWRIAGRVALSNFWTGTGLGSFSTVYPRYQDLNAPPVKAAHNDYLQVFAETGILGFLLFIGFWGYFLVWGLVRIPREEKPGNRWVLIGLYTGLLAFLIHSLVDFNFYNPSLATMQFLLAGLFLARTGPEPASHGNRPVQQMVVMALLVLTAFAFTGVLRAHAARNLVGKEASVNVRFAIASALVDLNPQTYPQQTPLRIPLPDLLLVVPDRNTIATFGTVYLYVPGEPPSYKAIDPGVPLAKEELPRAVVHVTDPVKARQAGLEAVRERIDSLKEAHEKYPRDPQVAAELFRWSDFLRVRSQTQGQEYEQVMAMLKWSEEGVRLSPESAAFRSFHGNALLRRGVMEKDPQRALDFYRNAIKEYRNATERWPTSEGVWSEYADVMSRYGEAFKRYGLVEEGERYLREAQRANETMAQVRVAKGK